MVLNQPTWGVDAGAATLIRNALIRQRSGGSAILVVSEELDELFEICDELVVMSEGKISPQVKQKMSALKRSVDGCPAFGLKRRSSDEFSFSTL